MTEFFARLNDLTAIVSAALATVGLGWLLGDKFDK